MDKIKVNPFINKNIKCKEQYTNINPFLNINVNCREHYLALNGYLKVCRHIVSYKGLPTSQNAVEYYNPEEDHALIEVYWEWIHEYDEWNLKQYFKNMNIGKKKPKIEDWKE